MIFGDDFTLRENTDSGVLEMQRGEPCGSWRNVPSGEREAVIAREMELNRVRSEFVGSYYRNGIRNVLICGLGPQLKRVTGEQIRHIRHRRDTAIIGINAGPRFAKLCWGMEPDDAFDAIVGADEVTDARREIWGWNLIKRCVTFRKTLRKFGDNDIPLVSTFMPSLTMERIFYMDTVTAAINIALIGLATETTVSNRCGPFLDWRQAHLKRAGCGWIVLVGVEHNRFDHAYTSDPRFLALDDNPLGKWPDDGGVKAKAHADLEKLACNVGASIFNTATWSAIDAHPFADFEEVFDIPAEMRTGVTSKGMPARQSRARPNEIDSGYKLGHEAGVDVPMPAGYVKL
jgi:hypothetical protein